MHMKVLWTAPGTEQFIPRPTTAQAGFLVAQGRVLDAVADGDVLRGPASDIAIRLGVPTSELRAAVDELAATGWVSTQADGRGALTVRWADEIR
jgi:hypothetical protein